MGRKYLVLLKPGLMYSIMQFKEFDWLSGHGI